ncbi:MAG: FG-GAP repeat protein [candidate division BRC1 bacterium ADurb.BinA364]|nr:MAG: FG-GAP repeat protein [candidate division BRC1 bacterium ADurb.BinA364]
MRFFLPLLPLCCMGAAHTAGPAALNFKRVAIDETPPDRPWVKLAGDLNGDGKPDIVIGGAKGPLVWYANPGWDKFLIAEGGYDSVAGALADIDGDGDLDIVLGGVVWFENPLPKGDPAKGPWVAHPIEKRAGHDILAVDLDGDGKLDLVMRDQSGFKNKLGNAIHLYRQISPTQWEWREIPCPHGEGIAIADPNGDGRPDIVIGGRWYQNDGDIANGAWTEHVFAPEWDYEHCKVAAGDLNGDGRTDILIAPAEHKGEFYRIAWYEAPAGSPADPWKQHIVEERVESVIHALAIADMNGDGLQDIVAASMHQGQSPQEVAVYLNAGAGLAWKRQAISQKGSHDIAVCDFDGDGRLDILGANHGGPYAPVELWFNAGE